MRLETLPAGAFRVNCYVFWEDAIREAVIVDPGDSPDLIAALLRKHGLTVAAYMLTHGHMDHVSALAALHRDFPAPIGLHPADAAWAFSASNELPPHYGVPEAPPAITRALQDGQIWRDGGIEYTVIATPGHTPGGVCFHLPAAGILLAGDTLFAGSVGRTDLPGGDARTLAASLRRLKALDDAVRVFPGHGDPTTIGHEKRTNFFMR